MTTMSSSAGPRRGPDPNPHRRRSLPPWSDDRGATMILFAVVLIGLLALSGLVIDGGRLFAERRQQQNAADFASMAATRELDRYQRALLEADGTPTDAEDVLGVAVDSRGGQPRGSERGRMHPRRRGGRPDRGVDTELPDLGRW